MQRMVGIDVGGTYTDAIIFNSASEEIQVAKSRSTPDDPSEGMFEVLRTTKTPLETISLLLHGTTVTTNVVVERNGATTGLITTAGFEDVLEVGDRDRPDLWGLRGEYEPLVDRRNAYGIDERTLADGTIRTPVPTDDVRTIASSLLEDGVESVVISFLNSYANPENEKAAAAAVNDVWPNEYVVRSSAILPEIHEFKRTSTAAITGYTMPGIESYLDRISSHFEEEGFSGELMLIQSNGGLMTPADASRRAAHTVLSGPAAGVTAVADLARSTGYENVISCDMGGTSFDAAILPEGEPVMTQDKDLEFQIPIRVPMIDITAIGLGGGSIARLDDGNLLRVGPESAGADPGPICYGSGGTKPTITDANLLLNRINDENPIGELDRLDREETAAQLQSQIGDHLDLSVAESAHAIITIAAEKMVRKLRELTIETGNDPREFTLVAFGGAGPLHAGEIIQRCEIPRAIIPYYPGIMSAYGCLLADLKHDHVTAIQETLSTIDMAWFWSKARNLRDDGVEQLPSDIELESVEVQYEVTMRYAGQTHSIRVSISEDDSMETLQANFLDTYRRTYGALVEDDIFVESLHVTTVGQMDRPNLESVISVGTHDELEAARTETRPVYFEDGWVDTTVYRRDRLPLKTSVDSPAIIEQADTTVLIPPGLTGRTDASGNLMLEGAL